MANQIYYLTLSVLLKQANEIADIICGSQRLVDTKFGPKTEKGIADLVVRKITEDTMDYDDVMAKINRKPIRADRYVGNGSEFEIVKPAKPKRINSMKAGTRVKLIGEDLTGTVKRTWRFTPGCRQVTIRWDKARGFGIIEEIVLVKELEVIEEPEQ